MTWKEVGARFGEAQAPAVMLPLGSIEAHGPHLPLDTDTVIAVKLAETAAELLAKNGTDALCAPAVPLAAASWAEEFPGTVSLTEEAARGVLSGAMHALKRSGASRIAIVNLHFDPVHMVALRAVVDEARLQGLPELVFTDLTRRNNAKRIGGEFATGSCHGGEFETSLMLAADPALVRPSYRELPFLNVDLAAAIREGKRSFRQVGLKDGYCGNPAKATAQEGWRLYHAMAQILFEEAAAAWKLPRARKS